MSAVSELGGIAHEVKNSLSGAETTYHTNWTLEEIRFANEIGSFYHVVPRGGTGAWTEITRPLFLKPLQYSVIQGV